MGYMTDYIVFSMIIVYPYFTINRAKFMQFDIRIFETDCDFITKYSISIAAIKQFSGG